ncbi:MAG: carbonic anhydrase family protein [Candidatus Kuenenia sp.]|nr:carbonic anhydrase family protein [Candidatus Kuenenia hertensis]
MIIVRYITIIFFLVFIPLFTLTASFAESEKHTHHAHWDYYGACGPEHWGELSPEYCKCGKGRRQSPISITVTEKEKLDNIEFNYYPTHLKVLNTGHTLQTNYEKGSYIKINNHRYNLIQFHFHFPSEHHVHGISYDMEAHFVHKDKKGRLAVVAVFMEEGRTNDFLYNLWKDIPHETGKENLNSAIKINAGEFLPEEKGYYTYSGSLTTPPGTEHVSWFVLKKPVEVSPVQVEKFHTLFEKSARPIQHPFGRTVKESY